MTRYEYVLIVYIFMISKPKISLRGSTECGTALVCLFIGVKNTYCPCLMFILYECEGFSRSAIYYAPNQNANSWKDQHVIYYYEWLCNSAHTFLNMTWKWPIFWVNENAWEIVWSWSLYMRHISNSDKLRAVFHPTEQKLMFIRSASNDIYIKRCKCGKRIENNKNNNTTTTIIIESHSDYILWNNFHTIRFHSCNCTQK